MIKRSSARFLPIAGAFIMALSLSLGRPIVAQAAKDACDAITDPTANATCEQTRYTTARTAMTAELTKVLAAMDPAEQTLLKSSQSTWEKWQMSDCAVYEYSGSGSISTLEISACSLNRVSTRTAQLKSFMPQTH